MTPNLNPLIKAEYVASLILGGALANDLIGGFFPTILGAFGAAMVFFALSMTILVIPIAAALWGYGIWFIMDLITQGNQRASIIAALVAAVVAGISHKTLYSSLQTSGPTPSAPDANAQSFSPYTKYVDKEGREYDADGKEIV